MTKYKVRETCQGDINLFYQGKKVPQYIHAWTAIYDGDIAAIAGLVKPHRCDYYVFFSDINNIKQYSKLAIWTISCYIVEEILKLGIRERIVALGKPEPDKYLLNLGFTYSGEHEGYGVYDL